MKLSRLIILCIIFAIISSLGTVIAYMLLVVEKIEIVQMEVNVAPNVGLNADTDKLRFGKIMPGTQGERGILITNNASYQLRVGISNYGDISRWLSISDNNFVVQKNEVKELNYTLSVPKGTSYGNYTGYTRIVFKKKFLNSLTK